PGLPTPALLEQSRPCLLDEAPTGGALKSPLYPAPHTTSIRTVSWPMGLTTGCHIDSRLQAPTVGVMHYKVTTTVYLLCRGFRRTGASSRTPRLKPKARVIPAQPGSQRFERPAE